jgi:endonuclease G
LKTVKYLFLYPLFIFLVSSCTKEESILPDAEDYTPTISKGYLIKHTYYTLSYSNSDRQSEFAYYYLSPQSINGGQSRTDDFRIDPKVKSNPVSSTGYQGSGYDRGHLCPAADMALNKTSMSETFYMSNMSPMTPSFNRGIWSSVEAWVRSSALSNGGLYVVTGPILNGSCGVLSGGIVVPCSFYKIAFKGGTNPKVIGFILSNSGSSSPVRSFAVSVDEIEKRTGINFFSQLEDGVENQIEGVVNYNGWNL